MNVGELAVAGVILTSIAAIITKISSRKVYVLLKPLPLLILFLFMLYSRKMAGSVPSWFIFVMSGIGLGLLGDLFLLGKKRIFAAGILSFILGHVCYTIAFNIIAQGVTLFSLLPVIPAILYVHFFKKYINEKKAIVPAVYPYFAVIVVMCISAFNVDLSVNRFPVYGLAGLLFCISDALLVWGSFIASNKFLQASVLICYYPAQIIIAFYTLSFFE